MKSPRRFVGTWRLTETELWDEDALDLVAPAHVTFKADGLGSFQLVAIQGEIDARFDGDRVEFTWAGDDDWAEASGRGWGALGKDGKLRGRIYFHLGNESSFVASKKE